MTLALWRRILSYLGPHRLWLAGAAAASAGYAALDAFSIVVLIPFLEAVFGDGAGGSGTGGVTGTVGTAGSGGAAGAGGAAGPATPLQPADPSRIDQALELTVGRFVNLDGEPQAVVGGVVVFILCTVMVKNVFDFARAFLSARVEQGVMRDLRNQVYGHLLHLDLAFFGRVRTGQIVSRLTHDVEQLRTLVTAELVKALSSILLFFATLWWMLLVSVELTAAAFVVVPLTMVVWGPLVKRLRKGDRAVLDTAGEVNAHLQETVSGIRMVKSASAEPMERRRFRALTDRYFRTFLRTVRLRALAGPMTEVFVAAGTGILLWYGARLVVGEGSLSGEAFIGFIFLSTRLYAPVKYLSKLPALVQPGVVGAERVFEFLDAPATIRDRLRAVPFPGVGDGIRFEDVTLEYRPGRPVLQNVTLQADAGRVTAIVGPSGAGKTSLADLLGRFHEPSSGRVRVGGVDVREISLGALRGALGVVSQDSVLFHDTVRANIAYGADDAPMERVEAAARAALAHDFVMELPEGYDTVVGERGTMLSGGQRQRIAIARAVFRDPPILILDEATSALDAESERLVQEALRGLLAGRTVLVIAHRLSTIRRADRIVVLEEGRVAQQGSHDELMAAGGPYRRLCEVQFR